jgi:hypothetical protein
MTELEMGCCGAYCRTCKARDTNNCKGCKLGYDSGERDINRAKCKIKLCCFRDKGLNTCADCKEYETCDTINSWFAKGSKYKVYKRNLDFIKEHGYEKFLKQADGWSDARGKLD